MKNIFYYVILKQTITKGEGGGEYGLKIEENHEDTALLQSASIWRTFTSDSDFFYLNHR